MYLWKTKYIFLLISSLLGIQLVEAQNLSYARATIKSLCDARYQGRGYVNLGEKLASAYLENQFDSLGLESFDNSYFQYFNVAVNTLPNNLILKINGKLLTPGEDYLLAPSSPSISKVLNPIAPKSQNWDKLKKQLAKKSNSVLVLEDNQVNTSLLQKLKFSNEINLGATILLTDKKLTWHAAPQQAQRPFLTISNQAISGKIKRMELVVDAQFYQNYQTQNVIGRISGESDSMIVLSAHYDHLGRMGKDTYFPGANDNASGTALMLDLARHYADKNPKYTLVFMAFGAEELGLKGSSYFLQHPLFPLNKIKFMLNFDIAGTGDDGIQVVNGTVFMSEFEQLKKLNLAHNLLKQVKVRGESCNSDHCPFYQNGVPSFFMYTLGGIQAYHDIYDQSDTLPLTAYKNYFKLMSLFINSL